MQSPRAFLLCCVARSCFSFSFSFTFIQFVSCLLSPVSCRLSVALFVIFILLLLLLFSFSFSFSFALLLLPVVFIFTLTSCAVIGAQSVVDVAFRQQLTRDTAPSHYPTLRDYPTLSDYPTHTYAQSFLLLTLELKSQVTFNLLTQAAVY